MEFIVDDVLHEADHPIMIKLKGDDLHFVAQASSIAIFVDEKSASDIATQIGFVLQDRNLRKDQENNQRKSLTK